MLYSEFLTGTGAPCNGLSHIIYTGLNRIYMRHDEYTKEEAYRDGQKILEDLGEVVVQKRTVTKLTYYHGIDKPFTYTCGYCGLSVDKEDQYCRFCGAEFEDEANNLLKQDKERKQEDEKQEDAGERTAGAQLSGTSEL